MDMVQVGGKTGRLMGTENLYLYLNQADQRDKDWKPAGTVLRIFVDWESGKLISGIRERPREFGTSHTAARATNIEFEIGKFKGNGKPELYLIFINNNKEN